MADTNKQLGGGRRKSINIEYCCGFQRQFDMASEAIHKAWPDVEVVGNPSGTYRVAAFEVTDDAGHQYWENIGRDGECKGLPTSGEELVHQMAERGFHM